jgi:hypothetical protein
MIGPMVLLGAAAVLRAARWIVSVAFFVRRGFRALLGDEAAIFCYATRAVMWLVGGPPTWEVRILFCVCLMISSIHTLRSD